MTLHSLQRSLKGFDIREEVRQTIVETADNIAELNRGQMFIGKRADDSEILPTYSDLTIEIKDENGQPSDRVTLKDSGAFWASIKVNVATDTFEIMATDEKSDKLQKKYGTAVLGLSNDSKYEEYIPLYFMPELKKRIESKTVLRLT